MSEQAEQQSMLFQVDSPVSPFLWPVSKKEKKTTDIYGPKCFASSESLNRITSSVRMYLESSTSRLTRFVPTWSVRATKSGYLILKLRLSALRTEGTGPPLLLKTPTDFDATVRSGKKNPKFGDSGSLAQEVYSGFIDQRMWPTPCAMDTVTGNLKSSQQKPGSMHSVTLPDAVRMWTTPRQRDWKGQTQRGAHAPGDGICNALGVTGGQLNPTWVEWLMGYPENYTEVD